MKALVYYFLSFSLCCLPVMAEDENRSIYTSPDVEHIFIPDVDKAMRTPCALEFKVSDIPLLEKKSDEGDALAQAQLGVIYAEGKLVAQDIEKAFNYFSRSAEQDCPIGLNGLGLCYCFGWSVPKDLSKAFSLIRKSAEKGYANAQLGLGTYFANGLGPIKKNMKKAFFWYGHAAEQGCDIAQAALACCYYSGEGCVPNKDLAFKWMFLAAKQGKDREYKRGALLFYTMSKAEIKLSEYWRKEFCLWLKKISDEGDVSAVSAKIILNDLESNGGK